ncbi:unnamed protein product, partial [Polarella glacialis]
MEGSSPQASSQSGSAADPGLLGSIADLRALAADASLEEAASFLRCCIECLREQLCCGSAASSDTHARSVAIVIRGDAPGASGSGASVAGPWLIKYWDSRNGDEGALCGEVHEGRSPEMEAASVRMEATSVQVILDLAAGRTKPLVAFARRRVTTRGDLAVLWPLAPVFRRAIQMAAGRFAAKRGPSTSSASSPSRAVLRPPSLRSAELLNWMPDDASPGCMLCGKPWMALIRQRHHCRVCGMLVCGRCSDRGTSGARSARSCLRCQCGTPARWRSIAGSDAADLSSCADGMDSCPISPQSTATFHLPHEPPESRPQPPRFVGTPLVLPAKTEIEGLLYAQIDAGLVSALRGPIAAVPPGYSEKRLWERVLAAERLEESGSATLYSSAMSLICLLVWKLLGLVLRISVLGLLAATLCLSRE